MYTYVNVFVLFLLFLPAISHTSIHCHVIFVTLTYIDCLYVQILSKLLVWDSQKICRCYMNLSGVWMLIGACTVLELNEKILSLVSVVQQFQRLLIIEKFVVQSCACV